MKTCNFRQNLSVHQTGVPLRFTPAGDFCIVLPKFAAKKTERLTMTNLYQIPPYLIARAISLILTRRVHFPRNRAGEIVQEEEDFVIFRQVFVDPLSSQPEIPSANFKVCFHFASFSANMNKILSLIPIPFIIAQPGFRSKT
jgi:hypothetical protein